MDDRDYVLGTHDEEIDRLGMQHRVWRSRTARCWERAGITVGQRVLDVGAGPGYATVDLAEIVGPQGQVVALERSDRFIAFGRHRLAALGLTNAEFRETDLVQDPLSVDGFDAAWCRWVLSFVTDPALVVAKIAQALRPGGVFVCHEYVDYATWRFVPERSAHRRFVEATMRSWRDSGGEPDIGQALPGLLRSAGFDVRRTAPIVFTLDPGRYSWQWPSRFLRGSAPRLVEAGQLSEDEARDVLAELDLAERDRDTMMLSPMVVEIVATRT